MSTHQLQQQQRNRKVAEVYSPRKSARLNNEQGKSETGVQQQRNKNTVEVYSPRKSARLNNEQGKYETGVKIATKSGYLKRTSKGENNTNTEATSKIARKSAPLKHKPKSTEKNSAQKSVLSKNPQEGIDENGNLKSASVRRRLDLPNPRNQEENMDENYIQVRRHKLTHT